MESSRLWGTDSSRKDRRIPSDEERSLSQHNFYVPTSDLPVRSSHFFRTLAGGLGKYDSLKLPSIKHCQRSKRAISEDLGFKPRVSYTRIGLIFPLRFSSSGTSRSTHIKCVFGRYIRWIPTPLVVKNDKNFRHKVTTSMLEE
jgi:hypothetical protein